MFAIGIKRSSIHDNVNGLQIVRTEMSPVFGQIKLEWCRCGVVGVADVLRVKVYGLSSVCRALNSKHDVRRFKALVASPPLRQRVVRRWIKSQFQFAIKADFMGTKSIVKWVSARFRSKITHRRWLNLCILWWLTEWSTALCDTFLWSFYAFLYIFLFNSL